MRFKVFVLIVLIGFTSSCKKPIITPVDPCKSPRLLQLQRIDSLSSSERAELDSLRVQCDRYTEASKPAAKPPVVEDDEVGAEYVFGYALGFALGYYLTSLLFKK
jgi:hypothetical protein